MRDFTGALLLVTVQRRLHRDARADAEEGGRQGRHTCWALLGEWVEPGDGGAGPQEMTPGTNLWLLPLFLMIKPLMASPQPAQALMIDERACK